MHVHLEFTGTTPLLMHNSQLSDPDNQYTKAISALTDKKNKTEADQAEIAQLEWLGGLYLDESSQIVMPSANIKRMTQKAGAITREGTDIARALIPYSLQTPLIYKGPTDLKKLYAEKIFVDQRMVKIGRGLIKRTRPKFPGWSVHADFELLDDIMDYDAFLRIIDRAKRAEGLGDGRILGFGRFEAKVVAEKLSKAA